MRKAISFVLLLCLVVTVITSCSSGIDKQKQTYDEGFEDIERLLVDKYGDYVIVDVAHMLNGSGEQVGIIVGLCCKDDSYVTNPENREKAPAYMIIEDCRQIINKYVSENPESLIAQYMINENKTVSLQLSYLNGDKLERLFAVDNDSFDQHYNSLVSYEQVSIFNGKDKSSMEDNTYLEKMYDYMSQTGDDVVYIEILHKKDIDDEMQQFWIYEIMKKFPTMYESIAAGA